MTGRRRHSRYSLASPLDGSLRVREEIVIEGWDATEIVAVASVPCPVDERLTLEFAGNGVGQVPVFVRENRPFVAPDGSIRYRLRLAVEQPIAITAPTEGKRQA